MHIRSATPHDADAIRSVYEAAFPEAESATVAKLALDLLTERTVPPTIPLVAQVDGVVSGHVCFSPVTRHGTADFVGYILAPLAVRPEQQKRGAGSSLIKAGIEQAMAHDPAVILVYGDPAYYGRFGFQVEAAAGCFPPYPLKFPSGWHGMTLRSRELDSGAIEIACASPLCDASLW
ncbi:MAG: N-acetyltransferase [Verrucomicrobiaceae bacterium]|nr:N-acetyltransferase [Verrucomicrobiaceae bacterium]